MPFVTKFTVTDQHIKLIRKMFVQWQDIETGAPEIDPKRPYGNSDIEADVYEILSGRDPYDEFEDGLPDELRGGYFDIHRGTEHALQIILATGKFEAGDYITTKPYDSTSWVKVESK